MVNLTNIFQNAAVATGNGQAAGVRDLGSYTLDVQLGGSTSTVQFEGQASDLVAGATPVWRSVAATPLAGGSDVTSATADGCWVVKCAGLSQIRARISAYTGPGSVTIQGYGSYAHRW